jgi:hypothetical protein
MKRLVLATLLVLTTVSASAVTQSDDPNIESLARDLHALLRIANVAEDLGASRQVMLAIVDSDIKTLRGPRDDGTYRWASLQREEGGRVVEEKVIEHVYTEKELRYVTVSGANGFRVVVEVPRKRGTFTTNNRVYVRNILVDSTLYDGKTVHHEIPVNAWVNPGDANGVPLPEIAKSVKATAELGVESGNKKAVAEVQLILAKLVDDPTSPYFPAVKRLLQIRELVAPRDINRGQLKNAIDEALLSLPGELEQRTAEMNRAAEERKRMAETGETKGTMEIGDATPDVVNEMITIGQMLSGTLEEQTEARVRLAALIEKLSPKQPE